LVREMTFRSAVSLACALILAGCARDVFVMKNPKTGEVVQCRGGAEGASFFPIAQAMANSSAAESCAKGYEAAGWQRMN
jgi:hypothetical protein